MDSGMMAYVWPMLGSFFSFLGGILLLAAFLVLGFVGAFFFTAKLNPFQFYKRSDVLVTLERLTLKNKWFDLFRWVIYDRFDRKNHADEFEPYGFTFYVGVQGDGKTISVVHMLDLYKQRYPNCVIVTNFKYEKADFIMYDWDDLINVRNGTDGVIFAIDEIHSEYSCSSSKDVPESLLSEISQQRKQRIKIIATSQFFSRVAKPLREQANDVVTCKTYFKRFTVNKRYNAFRYSTILDNPSVIRKKIKPLSKSSFIQSNALRQEYDTYEKIVRMRGKKSTSIATK